ncbi:membrane protein insertase YidC [Apilactobacillus xinyiensis]|uniref:membrane protein insertase YidC n=1 Tax=Apilactobacillus xinyiensis TaxID=2841032 RepID=UPI001C7D9F0E|nr:membrane protein insertase YidC [Apilactobacillus xinyiensis]
MKKVKKLYSLIAIAMIAVTLSGCVRVNSDGTPKEGFIYNYLALPAEHILDFIAKFVGGYGWALIVLTVIVRLILLPIMVNQMTKSTKMQEKMNLIRPQMKEIQKRQQNAKTQEERMQIQQDMMALYRDNDVNMMGGIGCLPLLIQTPVFIALYNAIRFSPEVSHTIFMGIRLGDKNITLAILSLIAYLIQGFLMTKGMPEEQKKQMKFMILLNPIVILIATLQSPAGLGIYFFIGGIFICIQTLIINMYRPKIRREILEQAKKNPPKKVVKEVHESDKNNESPEIEKSEDNKNKNRQRNSGKQNRND